MFILKIITNLSFLAFGVFLGRVGGVLRSEMRKERVPERIIKTYINLYHTMAITSLLSLSIVVTTLGF